MIELTGGRKGLIYREENNVIRPLNIYSASIHHLLNHLHKKGFTEGPRFIKIDHKNETLSFVEGDTFNYPLKGPIASEEAIISAAKLLRKLHDNSADFLQEEEHHLSLQWMLPAQEPQEVVCHGDFTPYNVALKDNTVVGIFDFDTAHPAPRIWDIAMSIYCWAPFKTNTIDTLGSLTEQVQRAKLFCDSYGSSPAIRKNLVKMMIARLQALVDYMYQQANEGNEQFLDNIKDEHHLSYLTDISYLQKHRQTITEGVI